jgi:hypothetical protein
MSSDYTANGPKVAKPPTIVGRVCIHTTAYSERICGKPVPLNRPNGWLCIWHAQVVLRGEGVLHVAQE